MLQDDQQPQELPSARATAEQELSSPLTIQAAPLQQPAATAEVGRSSTAAAPLSSLQSVASMTPRCKRHHFLAQHFLLAIICVTQALFYVVTLSVISSASIYNDKHHKCGTQYIVGQNVDEEDLCKSMLRMIADKGSGEGFSWLLAGDHAGRGHHWHGWL